MREPPESDKALTLAPMFASKYASVIVDMKVPPAKLMAVAPAASVLKLMEEMVSRAPLACEGIYNPHRPPVTVRLDKEIVPLKPLSNCRPMPLAGAVSVVEVTVRFTPPPTTAM